MKVFQLAVLAVVVASASARVVILSEATAFHTDNWCADHHLGTGPSTCIQHSGCCYDGRIGICHSCDAHSDEWCSTYGGDDVKTCTGYAGCTFDYEQPDHPDGVCVSNSDPSSIVDEQTCEEALQGAIAAGTDEPECTANGEYEAEQIETETGQVYCADESGHEVPDTRMSEAAFRTALVNCDKERKKHAGMQCPNAVTLSTGNGEVMINDHEDVGNCDVSCNTDKDCRGEEWCCYNGCGYSCQEPIIPKADCAHLILDPSEAASDFSVTHGTTVTISCAEGHFGSDPIEIECKHGIWSDWSMDCKKDCEPYRIIDGRQRDYDVKGSGFHHGSKRTLECVNGYGAVAGSPDAMRNFKEKIECVNGAWSERTLECSACFDSPSIGPNGWWEGREMGLRMCDHDGDEEDPTVVEKTPQQIAKCDVGSAPTDPGSFDCLYYSSRPTECANSADAQAMCRVSCRTCEEMLREYKVKAIRDTKVGTSHPEKWLKRRVRLLQGFQNPVEVQKRIKVRTRRFKGDDDSA